MEDNIWTSFWDMHSGGSSKEKYNLIFIEATQDEAEIIFYNRFGHNPNRVSCTCCGSDYSISEGTLLQVTGYHRGCKYEKEYVDKPNDKLSKKYLTQKEFEKQKDVLFIYAKDIKASERKGELPKQGYIWVD